MTNRRTLALTVLGLAAALPQAAHAQTVYNPATSFNTSQPVSTDGVYHYGYEATLGGAFTLYDMPAASGSGNVAGDAGTLAGWYSSGLGDPPHINANTSGSTYGLSLNGAVITVQPGQLNLHPGPGNQYSVLRFTAPSAGLYSFSATFNAADNHPATTDVHVLLDGVAVADGNIDINGGGDTATLSGSNLMLNSGETLDFEVGFGGNDYNYDDTGLFATVTASAPTHALTAVALASGPDGKTRILWNRTDGAITLWTLNTNGAAPSYSSFFGPISGWSATHLSIGPDNATHILWTNADGRMTLWTLPSGSPTPSYGPVYGPYAGWKAVGVATSTDGKTHVLWNNANGSMTLWTIPPTGAVSYAPVYGPIAGWTAKAISTDTNNATHVLWDNANGAMTLWTLPTTGAASYGVVYGPYSGYIATGLSVGGNGATRVLWNTSGGAMTLWMIPVTGAPTYSPLFGPYTGWGAVSLAVGPDGSSHVLWDNADGRMTPWTLTSSGQFVGTFPTYGPY